MGTIDLLREQTVDLQKLDDPKVRRDLREEAEQAARVDQRQRLSRRATLGKSKSASRLRKGR